MAIRNDIVNCRVYVACKMSGADKAEMVKRAQRVCDIFREFGLTPISPVIEEQVKDEPGKLINSDKDKLLGFWKRDKQIICNEVHVVYFDRFEQKSFGMEREYGLARWCLWKPTVIHVSPGTMTSVAEWEDDFICTSVHEAARLIAETWGTRAQRVRWRMNMLRRTLILWLKRQLMGWR